MLAVANDGFEERSIVVPPEGPPAPRAPSSRPSRRLDRTDPVGAYLGALDALSRDGRWPRHAAETPAMHARRVAAGGLGDPAFPRLAIAYELIRYGGRRLAPREAARSRGRLDRLRRGLRG